MFLICRPAFGQKRKANGRGKNRGNTGRATDREVKTQRPFPSLERQTGNSRKPSPGRQPAASAIMRPTDDPHPPPLPASDRILSDKTYTSVSVQDTDVLSRLFPVLFSGSRYLAGQEEDNRRIPVRKQGRHLRKRSATKREVRPKTFV